jgi:hypothetical protein
MFRLLAEALGPIDTGGRTVFNSHPMQLIRFLEETWEQRDPGDVPTDLEVPDDLADQERTSGLGIVLAPPWDRYHLIAAYLIENSRAYEIFRRVIEEYAYGERLGAPSDDSQRWLRTTEQLFYSNDAPFQVTSLSSWVRPDSRASRRNAYFRMFGIDLNHGTDDNRPYPYPRAAAANTEFVSTFENLLRETWRGIEHFRNTGGARPTDDASLANLARRLFDMLRVRREGGNLNREEFAHLSTMSWFDLTLRFDSPIVIDLEAEATSPEERLRKIGERVGLPAHSRSAAYFRLADELSYILQLLEAGQFNTADTARVLYTPSPPAPDQLVLNAMLAIIRDWSIATGRDMKAARVSVAPMEPIPVRPTPRPVVPVVPPAASRDGRARVTRETLPA